MPYSIPVTNSCGYVVDVLLSHFPDLGFELRQPESGHSLQQLLGLFATYTRQAMTEGSLTTLKQCLQVADLLCKENDYLATAIQVIYLRHLHFNDNVYAGQLAHLLMPKPLYVAFCYYQYPSTRGLS